MTLFFCNIIFPQRNVQKLSFSSIEAVHGLFEGAIYSKAQSTFTKFDDFGD